MNGTSDILDNVLDYLENKDTFFAPFKKEVFVSTPESDPIDELMVRTIPGTANNTRYMDKTRSGIFQMAFYAKCGNPETAVSELDKIGILLDFPEYSMITDLCQVKIEPISSPVFVEKTEKNEYIFTASFGLEYNTKEV